MGGSLINADLHITPVLVFKPLNWEFDVLKVPLNKRSAQQLQHQSHVPLQSSAGWTDRWRRRERTVEGVWISCNGGSSPGKLISLCSSDYRLEADVAHAPWSETSTVSKRRILKEVKNYKGTEGSNSPVIAVPPPEVPLKGFHSQTKPRSLKNETVL